ncbi:Rap1a/Tai family immunity protein [Rhodoligotrophos defluvii]|uniref:Rap1a/Tai family immunity protein n=1 Tax=Rhodoligotrophos defluvii TaxID=2561934 RepID=UPI003D1868A2
MRRLIFALIVMGLAFTSAKASTGNEVLEGCRLLAVTAFWPQAANSFRAGECYGVLMTWAREGRRLSGRVRSCIPSSVTAGQLAKVVVRFMDSEPSILNEDFTGIVIAAFALSWPCD